MNLRLFSIILFFTIFISCDDDSNPLNNKSNYHNEIALMTGYSTSNILLLKNIDNGEIDTLINGFQLNSPPIWAINGEKFLFVSNRDIYSYSILTNDYIKITNTSDCYGIPSLSPSGDQFTFTSNIDNRLSLVIMNTDGTNRNLYRTNDDYEFLQPVWSPLGGIIVFMSRCGRTRNLYQFTISDSTITPFFETELDKKDPSWSLDGSKIAYTYSVNGISIVNIDGSNNIQISKGKEYCRYPVWSPDGSKLSYSQRGEENNHKYYYYDFLSDEEILIDDSLDNYVFIGSWSKDSKLVAYRKNHNNKETMLIYNTETMITEEIFVGDLSIFCGSFRP